MSSPVTEINKNIIDPKTIVNPDIGQEQSTDTVVNQEAMTPTNITSGVILLDKYTIIEPLNVTSGEADLYLCEYYGDQYVAKVYRRNVSIKPDVLRAIKNIKSPYIARLYDTGTYDDKIFEILPYYKNGSLQGKTFTFEQLRDRIIPGINEALNCLHKNGIIHKDLKPSNIMLLDDGESVAIIDFGISSMTDGNTVLVTQTGMTPEYSAPETFRSVYLEESDYYSFGITLYQLYLGHTPYGNLSAEEITQYLSIQKIPFPEGFPESLKDLISALTYNDLTNRNSPDNPNKRWTYEEVKKWCQGESIIIPGEANEVSGSGRIKPYKFNGTAYTDVKTLFEALANNWGNGKKQLYRGLLSGFFALQDPEIAGKCMDAEEAVSNKQKNEDVVFWSLIYDVAPETKRFYWRGKRYESIQEVGSELLSLLRSKDSFEESYWQEIVTNKLISVFLKRHNQSKALIQGVSAVESALIRKPKQTREKLFQYYLLAFLLSGDHVFKFRNQSFSTLDAFIDYLRKQLHDSYEKFETICNSIIKENTELEPQFEAWLVAIGKEKALDQWKKQ